MAAITSTSGCHGMHEVTRILNAIDQGDPHAAEQLLPLVYQELRRLASQQLNHERPGQTLGATALVHEAYVRLVESEHPARFANQRHFFAAAAQAMRRILVETARRKKRLKHGGRHHRIELTDQPASSSDEQLVALDQGLQDLSHEDALAAQVVELRHFAGLGHEQIAETLDITVYQARQKWTYARAWLREALNR
jgi:RNA polymerase sigma factor (TIGR02999 family)